MSAATGPVEEAPREAPPRPWGVAATLGLGLAVMVVFVGAQIGVLLLFALAHMRGGPSADLGREIQTLGSSGLVLATSSVVSAIPALALLAFLCRVRGWRPGSYLGLRAPSAAQVLTWLGLLVAAMVAFDLGSYLVGEAVVPEFMTHAYRTAGSLPLLLLALLVAAPLFEELFFRGFLFRGLEASALGGVGTVIVTAVTWASLHLQYDGFHMGIVLLTGLLLGLARLRTGSATLTVTMHALMNLVAVVETAVVIHG